MTIQRHHVGKRLADMTGSAESRAARLFLTLAERTGRHDGPATFIPITLSRQDIADLLGTTLETAIRLMSRWHKESVILTEGEGFTVPDLAALRSIAG